MRSRSNSPHPRLEHLEDRCTPGSALDLLAEPPLAPLGQSLLFLGASETTISLPLPGERTPSLPSQAADPAGRPTPADPGLPGPFASPVGSGLHNPPAPLQGWGTPPVAGEVVSAFAPDAQGEQLPFKGRLEGVVTVTPVDPPIFSVLVNGTGNATQLGEFTVAIPHLVNRANRIATGSYHFVAANGDTLSADFTGQATPTATPGVLSIVETATITGGTGRFAGASGSFTCERLYDAVAGTTVGSFNGTISVPRAGNP